MVIYKKEGCSMSVHEDDYFLGKYVNIPEKNVDNAWPKKTNAQEEKSTKDTHARPRTKNESK